MRIIHLTSENKKAIQQCAELLNEGFPQDWPGAWETMEEAIEEVHEALEEGDEGKVCFIALDDSDDVMGWIGGISTYDGNVWELHPLVVRKNQRRSGVGRALVEKLEAYVREQGGYTIMLGTDDTTHMTTLSDVDLYQNTWEHIQNIQNLRNHPFSFYQKLGYSIVGVLPDANGPGKPDIYMTKRIRN